MNDRAPNDYALGHNHEKLQRLLAQGRGRFATRLQRLRRRPTQRW
jgi:hypothetical protein